MVELRVDYMLRLILTHLETHTKNRDKYIDQIQDIGHGSSLSSLYYSSSLERIDAYNYEALILIRI